MLLPSVQEYKRKQKKTLFFMNQTILASSTELNMTSNHGSELRFVGLEKLVKSVFKKIIQPFLLITLALLGSGLREKILIS